jgi:hypothetical protein
VARSNPRPKRRRDAGDVRAAAALNAAGDEEDPLPPIASVPPTTEDRVQWIALKMALYRWVPGESHQEVMRAWGVSRASVAEWASEASRVVHRDIGSSEDIRAAHLVGLGRVARKCFANIDEHPMYANAFINAIALASGLGGCPPVTRTEVTGKDGAPALGADAVRAMAEEVVRGASGSDKSS